MKKLGRLSILAALLLVVITVSPRNRVHAATQVTTWAQLQSAFAIGLGGSADIQLAADITAGSDNTVLVVPAMTEVTLDLNGHILDRGLTEAAENGNVITVRAGGTLIIVDSDPSAEHVPAVTYTDPVKNETFTVTGGIITGGRNTASGGAVRNDGELTVKGGTMVNNSAAAGGAIFNAENSWLTISSGSISGNTSAGSYAGAIENNGTAKISGGTLCGNKVSDPSAGGSGGGAIQNKSVLVIDDCTICRNTARNGGAILSSSDSQTTIRGGTYSENKVDVDGGAIQNSGTMEIIGGVFTGNEAGVTSGGIRNQAGTLTIKGGEISNNVAKGNGGGLYVCNRSTLTMSGGTISQNKSQATDAYSGGGGVFVEGGGRFTMSGGTISGNEAALDGGGVCVKGRLTINGANAVISGNKAKYGGGVYAEYENSTIEMSDGTISGNEGKFLGGGVYVQKNSSFTMSGGKIINNTVLERDGWRDGQGGGIFVYEKGKLKISGGTISGNKAPVQGGGVYSWSQFELSGSPEITGNTVNGDADDVFLKINQNIKVSGQLSGTVGVKADDRSFVITSGLNGNGNASNFRSNVPGYSVGLNGDSEAVFQLINYNVEIDTNISNGTVETDKNTATIDETVTLTVKPATGYELDKLTVKKGNDEVGVSGSDNSYTFRMPAGDVIVSATFKLKKFTVTWVIEGAKEYETYDYGTTPSYKNGTPKKEADAQYTYTFKEWTPAIVSVTQDATYTAVFKATLNEYTVKFVNEDGTELQRGKVAYGTTPAYTGETPIKKADAQYTYTFSGWTPEIVPVTGDATYTVTYGKTVNKYTVRFVNEDGTELQSSDVEYGRTPAYTGETPTKEADAQYSYTFAGWTPEIVSVTGNATYTATYTATVNKYKITFVNEDGTELQSSDVEYGETPKYEGETPTKAEEEYYAYTFEKWSPDIVPVTGDATYTAVYTAVEKPAYAVSEGGDAKVTKGAEKDIVITVKRLPDDTTCFGHFTGVQIDGSDLAAEDYTAKAGSTVVTLKAAALRKLSVGSHTVTVNFDDGKAKTTLTVAEAPTEPETTPDTGDGSRPGLWISLAALSALGCGAALCVRKRSGESES